MDALRGDEEMGMSKSTAMVLRLMTCSGTLATLREVDVMGGMKEALRIVEAHAKANGFTDVKVVTDDEYYGYSYRYTATTPGGRAGRNIAFLD